MDYENWTTRYKEEGYQFTPKEGVLLDMDRVDYERAQQRYTDVALAAASEEYLKKGEIQYSFSKRTLTVTVWSDRSGAVQALSVTLLEQRNAMVGARRCVLSCGRRFGREPK